MTTVCPLCHSSDVSALFTVGVRFFTECANCDLLFTDPTLGNTIESDQERYDMHKNSGDDAGYVAHLNVLKAALAPRIPPNSRGLDFGCGPIPILSELFTAAGFTMDNYDPIYAATLTETPAIYDFISCCEVVEHFIDPLKEFKLMRTLIKPGGVLGVMTSLREGERRSPNWWYLRDQTHRCFYSRRTMQFLFHQLGWRIVEITGDVTIFQGSDLLVKCSLNN